MKKELKSLSQATLYFKKEHFKTAIPVSITAMLVMYTLNNSVSKTLPQTAGLKFIDIWIIFGLILHFLILILLIAIEHLPEESNVVYVDERKENEQRLKFSAHRITLVFARKVLPILILFFILFYFTAAFVIFNLELIDLG